MRREWAHSSYDIQLFADAASSENSKQPDYTAFKVVRPSSVVNQAASTVANSEAVRQSQKRIPTGAGNEKFFLTAAHVKEQPTADPVAP